jgi:hypothetical protein
LLRELKSQSYDLDQFSNGADRRAKVALFCWQGRKRQGRAKVDRPLQGPYRQFFRRLSGLYLKKIAASLLRDLLGEPTLVKVVSLFYAVHGDVKLHTAA